jgi:3'(2'), 5'-bisphosphate nucleotidase
MSDHIDRLHMNSILHLQSILAKLCPVVCEAGRIIMKYYEMDWVGRRIKHDGTPVTDADIASEKMIVSFLKSFSPDIPIISEEQTNSQSRIQAFDDRISNGTRTFWLVDPLDGTETFIQKQDRFTINIGLVQDAKPVLGVVYFPARDLLYSGISGLRAHMQSNASRRINQGKPVQIMTSSFSKGNRIIALIDSRTSDASNLANMLGKVKITNRLVDSNIHKICGVATGEIDVSTIIKSFEWDTAAGHAILEGPGGKIIDSRGRELRYGKPEFKNPTLIAYGGVFEASG